VERPAFYFSLAELPSVAEVASAPASPALPAALRSAAAASSMAFSTIRSAFSSAWRILISPGLETRAMMPEWPGWIASSSSFANSFLWWRSRSLPMDNRMTTSISQNWSISP
jgi:hypothetical protein